MEAATPRPRWLVIGVVGLAILAGGAVTVGLVRGAGEATFSARGVSFRYPSNWKPVPSASFSSAPNELTRDIVGVDDRNAVLVSTYRLNTAIDAKNFQAFRPEIVETVEQLVQSARGRVIGGPEEFTLDGMPALRFRLALPGPVRVRSILLVAFRGTIEYWVNCRYDDEHAGEFVRGCERIADTFDAP